MRIEIYYDSKDSDQNYEVGLFTHSNKLVFDIEKGSKKNVEIICGTKKRKTDSKRVKELFNKILELNYQKIVTEMRNNMGFDGYSIGFVIADGPLSINMEMWCPNLSRFENNMWMESMLFLVYIMELLEIARNLGFNLEALDCIYN